MTCKTLQVSIILSFFATYFLARPAFCAEAKVLTLHAVHKGAGKITIHLLPDRIKIIAPVYGGELVATAPKWDVVCFRRKEKMIFTTGLHQLHGVDTIGLTDKGKPLSPQLKKIKADKMGALPCSSYDVLSTCPVRTVWLLEDPKYPAAEAEMISRFFQLPLFEKIPLAYYTPALSDPRKKSATVKNIKSPWTFDYVDKNEKGQFKLRTVSSSYSEASKKDFEIPSGYKKVRTTMEIFFSNSQRNEVTDLLNEIGFQSQEGKGKKDQAKGGLKKSP